MKLSTSQGNDPDLRRWEIEVRPAEIARWRQCVSTVFQRWCAPRVSVELAFFGVSELLSNVVKHTEDRRCRLEVARGRAEAVVSVFDRSFRLPVISQPDWDAESGRGLWLLQQMTGGAGLGFERVARPWGKRVWFVCDLVTVEGVAS